MLARLLGRVQAPRRRTFVERPCIGCLEPFKTYDVETVSLAEQFCSSRCKRAFHRGYGTGMNLFTDAWERRRRWRADRGEWWR